MKAQNVFTKLIVTSTSGVIKPFSSLHFQSSKIWFENIKLKETEDVTHVHMRVNGNNKPLEAVGYAGFTMAKRSC